MIPHTSHVSRIKNQKRQAKSMDKMSKPVKILLGLLTIWPPIEIAIFVVLYFGFIFFSISNSSHSNDPFVGIWIMIIMIPHILTMMLVTALKVFYIVHLIMTTRIPEAKTKALWGAFLVIFPVITMVVYFFIHIWREPKPAVMVQNTAQESG